MYIYIHGFNSSPQSVKARQLGGYLERQGRGAEFACPALSHWPREAMHQLEALLHRSGAAATVLVGSSLGGFYATWLAEQHGCRAVLVNPGVDAHEGLKAYLGPQQNLYTGEPYELTVEHLRQLESYSVPAITDPSRFFLIVTTGDEVLDYREAVARFAGARQRVVQGSDHGFAEFQDYLDEVVAFGDGEP
ncbi:MAG: esterase [Betaproteobacteria bacterium]|nr:esterase [Betaproteobacteria bacterium]